MSRKAARENVGQCLLSGAAGPAENMAIDQSLLEQVEATGVPVLRIYSWREPTLSLGYFQRYDDRKQHRESDGVACVRRATGGGAILHHHELTYSISMPIKSTDTQGRLRLYRQMHDVFIRALSSWGIRLDRHADVDGRLGEANALLCFQRRTDDDLVLGGYKVLGSAQRRTRNCVLQHGSLLINASRYAPQLPGIVDLTSKSISAEEIARHLVETTASLTGISWDSVPAESVDRSTVDAIVRHRFGNPDWLYRR